MNEMYHNFARVIFEDLKRDLNGHVRYKVFPEFDGIVFSVKFKDFLFEYTVKDIQDKIYSGSAGEIVTAFKKEYKRTLLDAFFKTEYRKQKDKEAMENAD